MDSKVIRYVSNSRNRNSELMPGTEDESLTDFVASQVHQRGLVYMSRKKGELTSIQDSQYEDSASREAQPLAKRASVQFRSQQEPLSFRPQPGIEQQLTERQGQAVLAHSFYQPALDPTSNVSP